MSSLKPVFQVSEFNQLINHHLSLLGEVTIEGELGRWDIKNGKLLFGTVKDRESALDIFSLSHLVRNYSQFEPGMLVRVTGTAGLYKGSGKFRLFVSEMVPEGAGALQLAMDKLKKQLEIEGLFAEERKRPLPKWPETIALVTAAGSSAYYDVVKILTARMGGLKINLLPVSVQGRGALPTLLKAFNYLNKVADEFDLVILTRGGGSLEDLAAFNSEELCRAVYGAKIPVISAVGHEDNWSLVDYVADLRASTPSNAAELAVRNRDEVMKGISLWLYQIKRSLMARIETMEMGVERDRGKLKQGLRSYENESERLISRVKLEWQKYTDQRQNLAKEMVRKTRIVNKEILRLWQQNQLELGQQQRLLMSYNYQKILERGYSITRDKKGKVIRSVGQVKENELITTEIADGKISSRTEKGI